VQFTKSTRVIACIALISGVARAQNPVPVDSGLQDLILASMKDADNDSGAWLTPFDAQVQELQSAVDLYFSNHPAFNPESCRYTLREQKSASFEGEASKYEDWRRQALREAASLSSRGVLPFAFYQTRPGLPALPKESLSQERASDYESLKLALILGVRDRLTSGRKPLAVEINKAFLIDDLHATQADFEFFVQNTLGVDRVDYLPEKTSRVGIPSEQVLDPILSIQIHYKWIQIDCDPKTPASASSMPTGAGNLRFWRPQWTRPLITRPSKKRNPYRCPKNR
jgi:hypothetical protein